MLVSTRKKNSRNNLFFPLAEVKENASIVSAFYKRNLRSCKIKFETAQGVLRSAILSSKNLAITKYHPPIC